MTYVVVVEMWLTEAGRGELLEYEDAMVRLMGEHQGRLVAAFTPIEDHQSPGTSGDAIASGGSPDASTGDADRCDLVHVLEFASAEAFSSFLTDPARLALARQRHRIFSQTRVLGGQTA